MFTPLGLAGFLSLLCPFLPRLVLSLLSSTHSRSCPDAFPRKLLLALDTSSITPQQFHLKCQRQNI